MSRFWILLLGLFYFPALGADALTTKSATELEAATQYCLKNFPKGVSATQEGFEACLRSVVDQYYQSIVKLAWGEPKTPLVGLSPAPTPTPVPIPPPVVDRPKEEAKARHQFKALVKSARCQRCHVGMNASQFTLAQVYSVLNTPSHQQHLGPNEKDLLRRLSELFP